MSAIVALTAQNTRGVTAIHEVPPAFAAAQTDAVLEDIGADAVKTGMLFSAPLIEAVAGALALRGLPLAVDPVTVASSGSRLRREDAVATLLAEATRQAAAIAGDAVAHGLARLGGGDGPVHALHDVPATISRRRQQGAA